MYAMRDEPHDSVPSSGYYFGRLQDRQDRAVSYSLTAAHGWEFLLDNHLRGEEDDSKAVMHAAVLGEN